MTLVDTTVWIDHFRRGNLELKGLLLHNDVLMHPFIIGEIACGSLRNKTEILRLLGESPPASLAEHDEALKRVEEKRLWSPGLGWIDAHLLASALLSRAKVLTFDKRFGKIASALRIDF
jgi:predicted nucleic acid-binding protein